LNSRHGSHAKPVFPDPKTEATISQQPQKK